MSVPVLDENTSSSLNMDTSDDDLPSQCQQLHIKIKELEREKKEICDNYDTQRGKLQKLYIQKEEELKDVKNKQMNLEAEVERLRKELDEAKSLLFIAGIDKENEVEAEKQKAQAEIATLNQIVNESVQVSTTSQSEVKKLKQVIQMLELQLKKSKSGVKESKSEKERDSILLAPSNVLLGAKSLAKKVVGQLGNDSDYRSHDNLEDSMKKAQEDADVLRSVVIPLENQIHELSERLKKYESGELSRAASPKDKRKNGKNLIDLSCNTSQDKGSLSPKDFRSPHKEDSDIFTVASAVPSVSPSRSVSCDMCVNYEGQLVSQQHLTRQLEKQKQLLEAHIERIKEDLVKETHFRKCMEDKWNEKKEEHKAQVSELKSLYENAEKDLQSLRKDFQSVQKEIVKDIHNLKFDREKINSELEQLQKENDNLLGKHSAHSEQLRNESINFPDNVEDLHLLLLKTHEELISAKVAKETNEDAVKTLKCEIQLLREQMSSDLISKSEMESNLTLKISMLREQLKLKEDELVKAQNIIEKFKASDRKNERELKKHLDDLMREKKVYEESISELRSRVGSLQLELDTSEAVQKDFVKLSQSLQIELENIRGADTEVRWQHEDDVAECVGCKTQFRSGKKKIHCRHCGKIFCSPCLNHVILSGPNYRPSQVCQVCHTLLNRETAPYFSQEPPHSPD